MHSEDNRCAIKGLVVCNNSDLKPLGLQNGLALGCYQTSPEDLIVHTENIVFMHILAPHIKSELVLFSIHIQLPDLLFGKAATAWMLRPDRGQISNQMHFPV